MIKKVVFFAFWMVSISLFASEPTSFYDFKVKTISGTDVSLSAYKGKVVLVVNTASKCGLTPQYEGLEDLYQQYGAEGFVILAFPCNQFLGQEPGTAEEIQEFCTTKYNVTFPLFEKVKVNGDDTHPLYVFLKTKQALEGKNDIRWNFEKFLIDRKGNVVKRFSPKTKPEDLKTDIKALL